MSGRAGRAGHSMAEELFLPLPGGSWRLWSQAVLRGAGFPVRYAAGLEGVELAAVADSILDGAAVSTGRWPAPCKLASYQTAFEDTATRVQDAVRQVASDALFREALTWQNPDFVRDCVERLDAAGRTRDRRYRKREAAIAKYVQRYATKNDTIGFFGPVGWASWSSAALVSRVEPGETLTRNRVVSFESWAVEAVADVLAGHPQMAGALVPRPNPALMIHDGGVTRPRSGPLALSDDSHALLALCDGVRTVSEIAAATSRSQAQVSALLSALEQDELIMPPLRGPLEPHADRRLADRLARMPAAATGAAVEILERLRRAKGAVAAAAGDPAALELALRELDEEFERVTGQSSRRLSGRTYAARTLVYEDAARDVSVVLGAPVLDALGEPLTCVLDSARWLLARLSDDYAALFEQRFERRRARSGTECVPLAALLASAAPDLYTGGGLPPLVGAAVQELHRRWARVIGELDPTARWVRLDSAAVRERVGEEFAAKAPGWAGAACHSPDIMIAASSIEAVNREQFQLVLGEVHLAYNTVESAALVEQHSDRPRVRAMSEKVVGPRRVVLAPPREWGFTARTSPSAHVMSPEWVYWALEADDVAALPGSVVPAAALEVFRDDGGLRVRSRLDNRTFPFLEVVGAYLSQVSVNAFSIAPVRRHTPRISIGRLVVAREKWTLPARACAWAQQLDERRRYLQMREWVTRWNLPRHAFYVSPLEAKPTYVDFTSIPLVNNLATDIRHLTRDSRPCSVTISEMLPGPEDCWLVDAEGQRYVCELRAVVTEHAG